MVPSRAIFLAIALTASGYALSFMADSMMGSSSWTAVFGRPLLTASSTFRHCAPRGGGSASASRATYADASPAAPSSATATTDTEWRRAADMADPPDGPGTHTLDERVGANDGRPRCDRIPLQWCNGSPPFDTLPVVIDTQP